MTRRLIVEAIVFYNRRMQKFDADGAFLTSFGSNRSSPGQFLYPVALATAPGGILYVPDFGNHRVQKWRSQQFRTLPNA